MKRFDVTALGELLIDFTESGVSVQGNLEFEANPGGAPCNVLSMLSRLGKKTAFIGKVGDDIFGRMLAATVSDCGINTEGLIFDKAARTTLAFVHTLDEGEREFSFYRDPGADMMLSKEDVKEELILSSKIFHFGTLSSTHTNCREATRYAINIAKENGVTVSFDPNLRESLWNSLDDAGNEIEYGLSKCDVLKISDNELEFVTGCADLDAAANILRESFPNIKLLLLTLGKDGSRAYFKNIRVDVPAFTDLKAIEKTGAGDTFMGCALSFLLENSVDDLTEDKLLSLLTFANAGASIITTRKGALKVMPSKAEILELIK
ncbi:MAG: carbohydrate kinase [Ruminococcaceae bacterium]|nr:carbohydrate kinase [Oscillospiraceae bacterium]